MAPDELEKVIQDEMVQRKKERVAKMKINSEMQETIKKQSDPIYMEVSNMYEE